MRSGTNFSRSALIGHVAQTLEATRNDLWVDTLLVDMEEKINREGLIHHSFIPH